LIENLNTNGANVLNHLDCSSNLLTTLDLSQNTHLTELNCQLNQLTGLNAANGHNSNFIYLWSDGNPILTCIELDDGAWLAPNWALVASTDSQTSFSENCNNDCSTSTVGLNELTSSKNLIQILDLMGREITFKPNTALIYVYDDGSTEKVFSVEY
jgi:hypothetical protein